MLSESFYGFKLVCVSFNNPSVPLVWDFHFRYLLTTICTKEDTQMHSPTTLFHVFTNRLSNATIFIIIIIDHIQAVILKDETREQAQRTAEHTNSDDRSTKCMDRGLEKTLIPTKISIFTHCTTINCIQIVINRKIFGTFSVSTNQKH